MRPCLKFVRSVPTTTDLFMRHNVLQWSPSVFLRQVWKKVPPKVHTHETRSCSHQSETLPVWNLQQTLHPERISEGTPSDSPRYVRASVPRKGTGVNTHTHTHTHTHTYTGRQEDDKAKHAHRKAYRRKDALRLQFAWLPHTPCMPNSASSSFVYISVRVSFLIFCRRKVVQLRAMRRRLPPRVSAAAPRVEPLRGGRTRLRSLRQNLSRTEKTRQAHGC